MCVMCVSLSLSQDMEVNYCFRNRARKTGGRGGTGGGGGRAGQGGRVADRAGEKNKNDRKEYKSQYFLFYVLQ